MVAIKICGVRRVEDARACRECGVDLAGFNFVPSSRRCIDLATARILQEELGAVQAVGLFRDADPGEILDTAGRLQLEWLQLHGNEQPEQGLSLKGQHRVIKAFPIRDPIDTGLLAAWSEVSDLLLLDGPAPGSGRAFDWKRLGDISLTRPFLIAGGLSAHNVGQALSMSRASGVDVASGVETEGSIDPARVRDFCEAARAGASSRPLVSLNIARPAGSNQEETA